MPPLIFHSRHMVAAAHPNYLRITNLPRCRLRLISVMDITDACLLTLEIIDKNAPLATADSLALFIRQQSIAAGHDVGWEGDIELGANQDLRAYFEDTAGVAPTAADVLAVVVGYEPLW